VGGSVADVCGSSANIYAMNSRSVESFYDGLASEYHLIFGDWWSAAQWNGDILSRLLAAEGVDPPSEVLDCTCGIGTQALSLATYGYRMTGTDLSHSSIARAKAEADSRSIPIAFSVADMRGLPTQFDRSFKAVISCDNALPHLLNDEDLVAALGSTERVLVEGGLFLASIRDYDLLRSERSNGIPPTIMGVHRTRHGYAQAWQWSEDGSEVHIYLFVLQETPDGWSASVHETMYRALLRAEMDAALIRTKFSQIKWLMPEVTGYYQPIVVARSAP
jgi:glycine/sarcosine N-methyltransferase